MAQFHDVIQTPSIMNKKCIFAHMLVACLPQGNLGRLTQISVCFNTMSCLNDSFHHVFTIFWDSRPFQVGKRIVFEKESDVQF